MIKHQGKFVSYLRVSTKRQGESGLAASRSLELVGQLGHFSG